MNYLKMERVREQFLGKEDCTLSDVMSADESLTFEEADTIVESVSFLNSVEPIRKLASRTLGFEDKSSDEYRSVLDAREEYAKRIFHKLDAELLYSDGDLQKSVFICTRYGGALDRYTSNAIIRLYSEGDISTKQFANLYAQQLGLRYGRIDIFDTHKISELNNNLEVLSARLKRGMEDQNDAKNAIRRIKREYIRLFGDTREPERDFKRMEEVRDSLVGNEDCSIEDVLNIDNTLSLEEAKLVLDSLEFVNENEELRRLSKRTHSPNDEQLNEDIEEARWSYLNNIYDEMIDLIRKGYDLRTIMFLTSRDKVSDPNSIFNVIGLLHQGYLEMDDVADLYVENLEEEFGNAELTDSHSGPMIQHYMSLLESEALRDSDEELELIDEYTVEKGREDIHKLIEKIKRQYEEKHGNNSIDPTLSPDTVVDVSEEVDEFVGETIADGKKGSRKPTIDSTDDIDK